MISIVDPHDTAARARAEAHLYSAIAAAAARETSLEEFLSTALEQLAALMPLTGGSIAVIDNDELVIRAAHGPFAASARGQRLKRNNGPTWSVIASGQPFKSGDVVQDGGRPTTGIRSYLAVALRWQSEIFGLLEVDSTQPDAFSDSDVRLLEGVGLALSGPIALTAQLDKLQREVADRQRAEQRLAAQYRVTRVLADAESFDEAAPLILQTIGEAFDWDLALMWCVDYKRDELQCTRSWQDPQATHFDLRRVRRLPPIRRGDGLVGKVWQTARPSSRADARADQSLSQLVQDKPGQAVPSLAFPIRGRTAVFGVIECSSPELVAVDADLLRACTAIGEQVGQFIERKRAERAQRESEEHKSAILSAAIDGIITIDHHGRITEWNPAAETIFGFRREVAIGMELADLIVPPSQRAAHRAGIRRYLATGESHMIGRRVELTAVRADGTPFPVELAITRIPRDGPPAFTGYIRDITEHKRNEAAIRFQARLLDVVEQAVVATDTAGTITYWNRFAETLYGWSEAEAIGQNIVDLTLLEGRTASAERVFEQLRNGTGWTGEYLCRSRDGRVFPVVGTESPIFDEAGQVIGVVGISFDISERKRAEDAQRFLAEASSVLSMSLDVQATLQALASSAVPALADACRVELIGDEESVGPHASVAIDAKLYAALEGASAAHPSPAQDFDTEVVSLQARGRHLGTLVLLVRPPRRLTSADRELIADLARRAGLAIENAQLYQRAQAAIAMRDEFLSIASHELKTPLTTVLGHTQSLQRRAARENMINERDQRALTVIAEQTLRLNKQIDTLLDVSRIELGKFQIDPEPVNMCQLARRVVAELEPTLDHHQVTLRCVNDATTVWGDSAHLEQALQNLLSNAVKYSPGGGTVRLTVDENNGMARIAVQDEGIGIPEAARPHLFQRFYRATNVDGGHISGLGIGLYLVAEIVERHSGTIRVDSQEGHGSTFTICLPLYDPSIHPDSYA